MTLSYFNLTDLTISNVKVLLRSEKIVIGNKSIGILDRTFYNGNISVVQGIVTKDSIWKLISR